MELAHSIQKNWGIALVSIALTLLLGTVLSVLPLSKSLLFCIAVVFGLIILLKFEYGIYTLLLFSVAGHFLGFDVPGLPPMYFVEIMLLILLPIWIILMFIEQRKLVLSQVNIPLIVILVWALISTVSTHYIGTAKPENFKYQINGLILLFITITGYFIVANNVQSERVAKSMIGCIIVASIPMGIYQSYLFFTQAGMSIGYFWKVGSFFGGNFLGGFYLIILLLLISLLIYYKDSPAKRVLIGFMISFIIFNLITSFNRATFISVVVSILFFAFIKNKKVFATILTCSVILFSVYPKLIQSITNIYSLAQYEGVPTRIPIAMDALNIMIKHPVFGIGFDRYGPHSHIWPLLLGEKLGGYTGSAHNDYLQMGVNLGIVGLGLFIWFLWSIWRETFSLYRFTQSRFFKSITSAFLAIIVGFSVECLASESIFGSFENGGYWMFSARVYFWALLSIVVGMKNFEKEGRSNHIE